ncbi:Cucumisin [Morella rubra]|uniref:Cucumisin n=1 Tax=Morella rubra TaxID=262757 RepID=A0A6A1VYD1_9ROSI|nr:Cucumisin [Morella rubra]
MASRTSNVSWLLLILNSLLASTLLFGNSASQSDDRKAYIVYMGERQGDEVSTSSLHTSMLQDIGRSKFPHPHNSIAHCSFAIDNDVRTAGPKSLIYSYKRSFSGFAANLTDQEAQKIAGMDNVVSVFPSQRQDPQTTRSWDFLGFSEQVKRSHAEGDIIIGVIDTGIWPESESFNDEGFGPPPSKWRGICDDTLHFTCNKYLCLQPYFVLRLQALAHILTEIEGFLPNAWILIGLNKIIGAQHYNHLGHLSHSDIGSPRDSAGHGTHCASTAAGNLVYGTSLAGNFAKGTARGGVPSARIAVYKVCWQNGYGCQDADILAAFDDAISDGVDIISISVVGQYIKGYFENSISIGAFHAMKKGILTSTCAGNNGPRLATIVNVSPWSLNVAASTIDRKFLTEVQLGNNEIYKGSSINTFDLPNEIYPLIYGGDAPNITAGFYSSSSRYCSASSLDKDKVKDKIVFCENDNSGAEPLSAGAAGTLMSGRRPYDNNRLYPLSAAYLNLQDSSNIYAYMRSTRVKERNDTFAPYITNFSSRGPSPLTFNILQSDLAAPGVHILAAWSGVSPISTIKGDPRYASYNIISGTSMAAHMLQRLLLTASRMSAEKNPEAEFAYGAGNLNPNKACRPGLVYDIDALDYVRFLCREGYDTKLVQIITEDYRDHCTIATKGKVFDLNYPSFALSASPSESIHHVFYRTVTNVGSPTSNYSAIVSSPNGLRIKVNPSILSFTSLEEKKSFIVTVEGKLINSWPLLL